MNIYINKINTINININKYIYHNDPIRLVPMLTQVQTPLHIQNCRLASCQHALRFIPPDLAGATPV